MMNLDRYYGPILRPFGTNTKPVKLQSKEHLKWIKEQPCYVSGYIGDEVDAHHVQKKSQIRNDYLTVPIRHGLHMQYHGQGQQYFQDHHLVNEEHALIAKLVERIIDLEAELRK